MEKNKRRGTILSEPSEFEKSDDILDVHFGVTHSLSFTSDSDTAQTPTTTDIDNTCTDEQSSENIDAFINERVNLLVRENSSSERVDEAHNNNVDCDDYPELNLQCLKQKLSKGCGCKKLCLEQFQENSVYDNVLNLSEMDKDQREIVIMSAIDIKSKNSTSTKRGSRKQFHCNFRFNGKDVCREAFEVIYYVGEVSLRNIVTHVKSNGITPRVHGNKDRRPHHAFTFDDIMGMVTFIRNYADEHGMPLPALEHGRDSLPPIYLPSSDTKINVHKKYQEACSSSEQRAAKYKSFYEVWRSCCPHIKIASPQEYVCGRCEKLRKLMKDARTEEEKLQAALDMQEHIGQVKRERRVYQDCIAKAKEELHEVPVPEEPVHPLTTDYENVHVTFDFAQGVLIPHHARQIGALYFLTPRRVQIFGVRFDGFPLQVNYLIDQTFGENGKGSHGPNTVISLLDHALEKYTLGEKSCKLHSDNCCGQNKNMYVLAYMAWRVMVGLNNEITLMMQMAGHARCLIDSGFAHIKRMYRKADVDSLPQLASVVEKSAYSNRAELNKRDDNTTNWDLRDWKSYLAQFFKSLKGITSYQQFRFSAMCFFGKAPMTTKSLSNSYDMTLTLIP